MTLVKNYPCGTMFVLRNNINYTTDQCTIEQDNDGIIETQYKGASFVILQSRVSMKYAFNTNITDPFYYKVLFNNGTIGYVHHTWLVKSYLVRVDE